MASSADALLARQENLQNAIKNALANLTKLGTANYSNAVITVRMNSLDTNWKEFKNNHLTLLSLQENLSEQDYIKNDVYAKTEEFYLTALATMLSLLETYPAPILPTAASSSQAPSAPTSFSRKLPEIKLPTFTVDYKLWPEFRDLFIAGVSSSSLLNNVEKLFYLKSSLAGDAAELVRGISLEGDNFQRTWNALKDAFKVPRVQVDALLKGFFLMKCNNIFCANIATHSMGQSGGGRWPGTLCSSVDRSRIIVIIIIPTDGLIYATCSLPTVWIHHLVNQLNCY
ncbi:uncharacterized protein LOC111642836 [Copidosoma floridanum]|uniref:uncharacterized protein LOC111642836 n=1 Tax=Copidosoma floridanum TaxID=29053 RepID=UPI000C6F7852|nr:uncharacterized protein LOC111642836 [Copidosoma floridanum]